MSLRYFDEEIPNSTPFEQKNDVPLCCAGSDSRSIPSKIKKLYKFKNFEKVGATFKEAKQGISEFLTEGEIQKATDKYKYIISVPPKMNCLMWYRRRFMYSAWHKCIMLTASPEQDCFPDCYQLDERLFDLSIAEQKEIAEEQSHFLLSNAMTDEDSFSHFIDLVISITGADFSDLKNAFRLAVSLFD